MTGTLVASTINAGASASLLLQSNNTTALTLDTSQNVIAAGTVAMASSFKRNRIINGNMLIDQRNAGAAVTPTGITYTLDRWRYATSTASKLTFQQSTTAPAGFNSSTKISVASAYTAAAADYFVYQQPIEGFNIADLGFGTASAKTVTLSFWVQSSLIGTYSGCIQNATPDRSYVFTYSITAANTWTQVSITIAGDTTGTWATGNTNGMTLDFDLGSGSNYQNAAGSWVAANRFTNSAQANFVGTSGATFYITGIQLEVGTKATPYEMQIYSDQLAQCQRYYENINLYGYFNTAVAGTYFIQGFKFSVTKRANPTMTFSGMSYWNSSGSTISFTPSISNGGTDMFQVGYNAATNACGVSGGLAMASAEL